MSACVAPSALPLSDFDYPLLPEHIAQSPCVPRDACRLMVLGPDGPPSHHVFHQLGALLTPGDVVVVNQTRVIPARVHVTRPLGGKSELLLHTPVDGTFETARRYLALGRPAKAFRPEQNVTAIDGTQLRIVGRNDDIIVVEAKEPLFDVMRRVGLMPLPPYLKDDAKHEASRHDDYQSLFAEAPGAVAAPTASLHFTDRTMADLRARDICVCPLTLHVGPGTFLPVRPDCADDVRRHVMHAEMFDIPKLTQEACARARRDKRRIVAVGTTVLRALETFAKTQVSHGASDLFIYPGYRFEAVDALVTNFHLPRSTLLMLVSAWGGTRRILDAYKEAQKKDYRFFSFGDAMLLHR